MERFSHDKAHIQKNKNVQYCPMAAIFFMQETLNLLLCELCMLDNFYFYFCCLFFFSKLTLEVPSVSNSSDPNQARQNGQTFCLAWFEFKLLVKVITRQEDKNLKVFLEKWARPFKAEVIGFLE